MLGRALVAVFALTVPGTLARPCLAQTDTTAAGNSTPAATSRATPAASPTPTPKKVWTNDDVPSAKPGPSAAERGVTSRAMASQTVDMATVQRIRKSLEKLQGQLDDVNKKLKAYKDFQEGEPVSTAEREINKGVNRVPVDQQIVQLREKKKQLAGQISDLYDEARKKGIDPGMLR
jgi:hypothetical protein